MLKRLAKTESERSANSLVPVSKRQPASSQ